MDNEISPAVESVSGSDGVMMDTIFEVKCPTELIVKVELAKDVPVELVLERHMYRDNLSNWSGEQFITAPDVPIPVSLSQDTLPYALLTRVEPSSFPVSTPLMASVSIRIIEKRNIRIKLKNLDFLANAFGDDASMKLVLSHDGALKSWQTEEMTIHENDDNVAEASIWISEDIEELITQFGRRKRYRTAHGEVSSLEGNFTLLAKWTIKPRPKSVEVAEKLERHQKFIQAKSFDHTVELIASNGKSFKISKALLAAFSEKIERQLQFLMDEKSDARTFKDIKIFSGLTCEDGNDHYLDEDSLRALIKFITMNSVKEPLHDPALSLELLMIASYNMITEMEKSMALMMLAQPLELYDVETSVYLFWFSSLKVEIYKEDAKYKRLWDMVRVRSLWNFKWLPMKELNESQAFLALFPKESDRAAVYSMI